MPPATQQPTNKTAVYAARRALHQPYYRKHDESKRRERPVSSNVYKRPDTNPAFRDDIIDKRCDTDPAFRYERRDDIIDKRCDNTSFDVSKRRDDVIDKRSDNTSFDVSKRSDDEAYPSVVSKVPYCCW